MEDRKIAMEIRRRKKDEKNRALNEQVQGMKQKATHVTKIVRKQKRKGWLNQNGPTGIVGFILGITRVGKSS